MSQKGSVTVTKRKLSSTDLSEKIKEKMKNFKVLAHCLDEYILEERKN